MLPKPRIIMVQVAGSGARRRPGRLERPALVEALVVARSCRRSVLGVVPGVAWLHPRLVGHVVREQVVLVARDAGEQQARVGEHLDTLPRV